MKFKKVHILIDEYPGQIIVNQKKYQYFLGCYLPCEAYQLSKSQLKEFNKIRLENGLVNWDYNKYMINILVKYAGVKHDDKILDFGCGNGFAKNLLKKYKYIGIDINDSWNCINNMKFDAVISSFVFDFDVTLQDTQNIYNCLKNNSNLVFNIYKFWDKGKHFNQILSDLCSVGFNCDIKKIKVPKRFNIRHTKDIIIIAQK